MSQIKTTAEQRAVARKVYEALHVPVSEGGFLHVVVRLDDLAHDAERAARLEEVLDAIMNAAEYGLAERGNEHVSPYTQLQAISDLVREALLP